MAAPKGMPKPPGSGRKKGTPNKTTTFLRDAILKATDLAGQEISGKEGSGAVEYLRHLAINHPPAFAGLLGKILPTQIQGDVHVAPSGLNHFYGGTTPNAQPGVAGVLENTGEE